MEELTGDLVLVNPKLTHDPAHRQGEIGIITKADLNNDEMFVGFGNKPLGLYSSDALLIMKPKNELYKDILVMGKELNKEDYKTVWRAHLLQEGGSPTQLRQALELLTTNTKTMEFGTFCLQDKINLALDKAENLKQDSSISR